MRMHRDARQRQPHGLAARQAAAALAQRGAGMGLRHVVERRKTHRLGHLGRADVGTAQCHVGFDRSGEDVGLLPHPRRALAQCGGRVFGERHTADGDLAARGRHQPGQQREQRGLARSARAGQRDMLAGADAQFIAVEERRRLAGPGEMQPVDRHRRRGPCPSDAGRCARDRDARAGQRQRAALQVVERLQRRLAGRAVVPDRRQLAQRLEEGRRQQQHEQAFAQAELLAPGAEAERAQQVETDVDRDQRHAQRGEQLQHGRRQERDAQHRHRALAQRLGGGTEPVGRGIDRVERAQRGQAAQAVEQEGVHAAHLDHLRLAGRLGAPADDGHEDRDQRRRHQQHQRRGPREPGHRREQEERHHRRAPACGLVAHEVRHQRLGLFGEHAGRKARGRAFAVQRRTGRQCGCGLRAQGRQLRPRAPEGAAHAPGFAARAQQAEQEDAHRRPQHGRHALAAGQALHRHRQQRRLRQPSERRDALHHAADVGRRESLQRRSWRRWFCHSLILCIFSIY
ncbi:hypothetical protein FQZ97_697210 [compost metagenome]